MEKSLQQKLLRGQFGNVDSGHSGRMRQIRSKGNRSTEVRFRAMLIRAGVCGWRMHPKGVPGKPDFFFEACQVAVFVDGCYWHGCPKCSHTVRVNSPYWEAKIKGNQRRDRKNGRLMYRQGLRVLRIWEHQIAGEPGRCIERLRRMLMAR
jgi:DNA mismatch endonuclease (patch repair protein)